MKIICIGRNYADSNYAINKDVNKGAITNPSVFFDKNDGLPLVYKVTGSSVS